MELPLCPRSHTRNIRAAAGSVLCALCVRQLERNLRTLPGLYQESLHQIAPMSRCRNPTKVSGSRKRDYLNVSVLDSRSDILAILESWSEIVVEELGSVAPYRSVPHFANFLLLNLEWLAAQPPAADLADEIEEIGLELLRAVDPDPSDRRSIVRGCVMDDCPGTINTSPQNTEDSGRARSEEKKRSISCSSGHSWEIQEWLTLRHLMDLNRKEVTV